MTDQTQAGRGSDNGRNSRGRGRHLLHFGRRFLGAPAMLGSVIPSSRYLVRRTLEQIDWTRAGGIVEYGPGMGTFTAEILRRMGPDGRLIVFETHPDFVRHLRTTLPDPRLEVVHGSAAEVEPALRERGWGTADYILSGIPFSLMPDHVRDAILESTRKVLAPDGAFLVYQFSPSIRAPLQDVFAEVDWEFEIRNFLPAMVFHCQR